MATINIIREKRFFGSFVSWDVAIGGQRFGTISSGQALQVQVPPGKYPVAVSKRHTSVVAVVEASDAAPATVYVRPIRPTLLTFLLPLVWIMLNRTRLIEMHAPGYPASHQPHPGFPPPAFAQPGLAHGWPGHTPNGYSQPPHMGYPPPPGTR